jgi:putative ABC transport system permease protein
MITLLKIVNEGVLQALQQLRGNKLRSFLSMLGISIGIFCIIGVLSAVNSLESNVRGSIAKLGEDVIYVQKFSWTEDPGRNWFKIMRRPNIEFSDYEVIKNKVKNAELVAFSVGIGRRTVKYRSNNVEGAEFAAGSFELGELNNFEFHRGRYFSPVEYYTGSNKIIIGFKVAEELFGEADPIGKKVKVGARHLEVIGVLKKAGESIINFSNEDEMLLISYELARKIVNLKTASSFDRTVAVKVAEGIDNRLVKDEITGALRAHRRLKPKEAEDFGLNELSILSEALDGFFSVLNMLGFVIGIFAIIVGMVSVANIMFVSVKERTGIIGIKKALGAKSYFILLEFLIEASILCLLGGMVGLLLVYGVITILGNAINFDLFLSISNILWGILASMLIGVLAGLIPAIQASKMDPVEAMRK